MGAGVLFCYPTRIKNAPEEASSGAFFMTAYVIP
jgi:hypothetical protein